MNNDLNKKYPNIFITRDAPLIIKEPSADMHYDTVIMEMGAYIEIRAGVRFQIEHLKQSENSSISDPSYRNEYPTLHKGEKLKSWNYHIIVTGEPGVNGKNGEDGIDWGESGDRGESSLIAGGNAPEAFTITINDLCFDTTILNIGGTGGSGGNGGNGANGYDGESAEKPGGIGGDGGNGGNGSKAGNACKKLTIRYDSTGDYIPSVDCVSASGGAYGMGGKKGRNGKYYTGSISPQNGANGSSGSAGDPGSFVIEKIEKTC